MDNKKSNSIGKISAPLLHPATGFRPGVYASGSYFDRRPSYWRWLCNTMKDRLVICMAIILMAGCSSNIKQANTAIFLREDLDLSTISRVAVLPFTYLSGGESNAKRVGEIFQEELLAANRFEVVDKETMEATLREMTINSNYSLDKSVLNILVKKLEVDAFLTGTVNRIEGRSWGRPPYPEISLTLHLIDAETAKVVWRTTAYRNAYSDNQGLNRQRKNKLVMTRKLLQEMIAAIPE